MVKVSMILIYLLLILHVHLTTTHALEGHNLTMLLTNISRHKLEKRGNDSFINFFKKGTIIRRPRNRPEFVSTSGSVNDCEKIKDPVAFSTCCALYNRNTVIDTPRPARLTYLSRIRLWWHDFTWTFTHNRFAPDTPVEAPPILEPNDPIIQTLEFTKQETRPVGPWISDGEGGWIFIKPLKPLNKFKRVPYCTNLNTLLENDDLCLYNDVENIIRPADLSKKKKKKQKTPARLVINPSEASNQFAVLAYFDAIDDETYRKVMDTFRRLANQFAGLEDYLRNLKEWAEAFGLSIKEAAKQFGNRRQVGESSNSNSRFMCDYEDNKSDDIIHDEFRK
ncbi:hypothetical protein C2G38_2279810 [Gigaspora rosea]|uniref:Uncharacterized protein n=1 Tax=Gigaspora rosea TaxID=44941 RepID=A0A397UAG9_9GLOM|nr:hypothetical protein C2G38_2279810 [Gigaspora rosea]